MSLHQRTLRFRQAYRAAISTRYSGLLHGGFVFGAGIGFIGYCVAQVIALNWSADFLRQEGWRLVIAFIAATLIFNIGEYIAHLELGHKKRRFAKLFYSRHSGDHHTFFSHEDYLIDNLRDLRVVLFPAPLLLAVTFIFATPLGWLTAQTLGVNAGWVMSASIVFNYLLYEFIHLCNHLPERHSITRWPFIRHMREYHRWHHHPDHATRHNFNITYPITDWILRTRR
jgi:hypothetical protein